MLPKGQRRKTVKHEYRAHRSAEQDAAAQAKADAEAGIVSPAPAATPSEAPFAAPVSVFTPLPVFGEEEWTVEDGIRSFTADTVAAGMRLDAYLAKVMPEISRARVQLLIEKGQVKLDGEAAKGKVKLRGGERIAVEGEPRPEPLRAVAEDIPLTVVFEDAHLAVIDKPAGMMVHAGSGLTEDARNSGTLVNALLHHFRDQLSNVGGELRPGIVHRLDKQTSGLIIVAKNDKAHRALAEMFSERALEKHYIALVHGEVGAKGRGNAERDRGTITLPIARDPIRRARMTTRAHENWMTTESHGTPGNRHPEEKEPERQRRSYEARSAISHYEVLERLDTPAGKFTLLDVKIETGRTHQIRVHMQAIGHPVVGDNLYGAPARIPALADKIDKEKPTLERNFLHAARLRLAHPVTGEELDLEAELPPELAAFLERLKTLRVEA
jgi:23S rRNA pseudouridine1911/1915/1917 synthase